jgi:hypothetical protein
MGDRHFSYQGIVLMGPYQRSRKIRVLGFVVLSLGMRFFKSTMGSKLLKFNTAVTMSVEIELFIQIP